MSEERKTFEDMINKNLTNTFEQPWNVSKANITNNLSCFTWTKNSSAEKSRKSGKLIESLMNSWTWVEDTMTTEDNPFIQVIAVLKGVE